MGRALDHLAPLGGEGWVGNSRVFSRWSACSASASLSSMRVSVSVLLLLGVITTPAKAVDLEGPARFCGYSPVIDLKPREKITTLLGAIHGGSFRWEGAFGSLFVRGIGWASRPQGQLVSQPTEDQPGRFAERKRDGKFVIAIWNGRQGVAYFESPARFTNEQRTAIGRVRLVQEGEEPPDCDLRTTFVWSTDR